MFLLLGFVGWEHCSEFDDEGCSLPDSRTLRPHPAAIGLDNCTREGQIEPCLLRVVQHIGDGERPGKP